MLKVMLYTLYRINSAMVGILSDIIANQLEIDVAFCRLLALMDYAVTINLAIHTEYALFLLYFTMASCLSPTHRQSITMHNIQATSRNSMILQYLIQYSIDLASIISYRFRCKDALEAQGEICYLNRVLAV
eukprot:581416_1